MPAKSNATESASITQHMAIDRIIDAPRELVFKAWTDAKHLAQWFEIAHCKTTAMEADIRPGGHWNLDVVHEGNEISVRRIYREIIAPSRIVFYEKCTMGDVVKLDGTHTVTFEDIGGKTRLTVTCDITNPFDTSNQQGWTWGWSGLFDRLAAHLAKD